MKKYIEVFKILPKINCKKCGFSNCLVFAVNIVCGKIKSIHCPYVNNQVSVAIEKILKIEKNEIPKKQSAISITAGPIGHPKTKNLFGSEINFQFENSKFSTMFFESDSVESIVTKLRSLAYDIEDFHKVKGKTAFSRKEF